MFTGIVEEIGEVVSVEPQGDSAVLRVRAAVVGENVRHGASIAVNGVCLTVVASGGSGEVTLDFDVMAETLKRSVIGRLTAGDKVNLERAARVDARLDGHVVQGHVDGIGQIASLQPLLRVCVPPELLRYLVPKGSITVDGVSLTVVEPLSDGFTVALIPHTAEMTTLGTKRPGDPVNIEVDVIAKYVELLVQPYATGHLALPPSVRYPGEAG